MKKKITTLLAGIFALVISIQAQSPTVSFTANPAIVCQCGTVTFNNVSTNGPTEWRWYFPGGTPSDTTVIASPGDPGPITYCTPGFYYVTCVVTNPNGHDSVTVQNMIQVVASPTVAISPPSAGICDIAAGQAFDTVYFSATNSPAYTYSWAPGGSLNCPTCSNPRAFPSVTTVYTLTVTNAAGCSTVVTDTVIAGSIVAKITGKDSICQGYMDSLYASGGSQGTPPQPGSTYIWSTGKTTSSIGVSPNVQTTYSVIITSGSGNCTSSAVFNVYPFPNPVFTLSGADSVCYPFSTIITAMPGGGTYNYVWNGPFGAVYSNIDTVSPAITTIYTLVVQNKGCYFDSLVKIKVNTRPAVRFTGATNLCLGSTTIVCASGGEQYHWSTGATTSCVDVRPPASITYTVLVTAGNCVVDTSFTIIVDSMPVVKFSGDTAICTGDSTTIKIAGGLTYLWTTGNTTDSIHMVYPTRGLYTYYVTVTKGACSKDSSKISVKVYPHPNPNVYPLDTTICEWHSTPLTATGATDGGYFVWTPKNSYLDHYKFTTSNDTDWNGASPTSTTIYTVNVCTWGCCATATATVNITPGPNGTVIPLDTTVASFTPVQITTTLGSGPYRVENWSPTYGLSCSNCNDPIATIDKSTTYTVTLEDYVTGCLVTDSVTIDIFNCTVFVPNIFSPNGDHVNDYFCARSLCLKSMDFAVFDRWGNKVYETTNVEDALSQSEGWDGTYHGKKMNMDTYMWYLKGLEYDGTQIIKNGNVTLIR